MRKLKDSEWFRTFNENFSFQSPPARKDRVKNEVSKKSPKKDSHRHRNYRRRSRSQSPRESKRDRSRDRDRDSRRKRDRSNERKQSSNKYNRDRDRDRSRSRDRHVPQKSDERHHKTNERDRKRPFNDGSDKRDVRKNTDKVQKPNDSDVPRYSPAESPMKATSTIPSTTATTTVVNPNASALALARAAAAAAAVKSISTAPAVELPSYYNPSAINVAKYTDQIQKRKLLWSNKNPQTNADKWQQQAQFSKDDDGKVASKFMRLMGIKKGESGDSAGGSGGEEQTAKKPNDFAKKQSDMLNQMEQQYEIARQATHTMRGMGLGFSRQF